MSTVLAQIVVINCMLILFIAFVIDFISWRKIVWNLCSGGGRCFLWKWAGGWAAHLHINKLLVLNFDSKSRTSCHITELFPSVVCQSVLSKIHPLCDPTYNTGRWRSDDEAPSFLQYRLACLQATVREDSSKCIKGFEVLTAVTVMVTLFWKVTSYSLV